MAIPYDIIEDSENFEKRTEERKKELIDKDILLKNQEKLQYLERKFLSLS